VGGGGGVEHHFQFKFETLNLEKKNRLPILLRRLAARITEIDDLLSSVISDGGLGGDVSFTLNLPLNRRSLSPRVDVVNRGL